MDSANRLRLVSKVTYYIGWLSAVLGGLVHFGIGVGAFRALHLSQRNLFEGSVMLFMISAASSLRAAVSLKTS